MRLISPLLTGFIPATGVCNSETLSLGEGIHIPEPFPLCDIRAENDVDAGVGASRLFRPTPFQVQMLGDLRKDVRNDAWPWLGLAAPMQTGKSKLIGPIVRMIREELGEDVRVIVLSSGRIITRQLLEDLTGQFGDEVARFDGLVKDKPGLLTVASVWAMANHLDQFPTGVPTVLINDEAYSTQAATFRDIYTHFGLGEVRDEGEASYLRPCEGNGLVIGFSGTGGGLEGYRVSGHLDLLSAIDAGLIRHLRGDRIVLTIPNECRQVHGEERIVWWEPTEANAKVLAEIYDEKIRSHYRKNLVYVPTIQHGRLLLEALKKKCGKSHPVRFVHSDISEMSDEQFLKAVKGWEKGGGALISINRLARGYRATGADAVFHTYQSNSPELFANRTGRAWGMGGLSSLPDLYVLEVTWDPRGSFANLARLMGLIDYPGNGVSTRSLQSRLRQQEEKEKRRRSLLGAVDRGDVDPIFVGIPLVEGWRQTMERALKDAGGVAAVAEKSGLSVETIAGFALGALPVRWEDAESLAELLGGSEKVAETWIKGWSEVVDEILGGRTKLTEEVETDLFQWRECLTADAAGLLADALALNHVLQRHLSFWNARAFRRSKEIPITEEDRSLLVQMLSEVSDPHEAAIMKLRLSHRSLDDPSWRRIWQRLAQEYRGKDSHRFQALVDHFFQRQGWLKELRGASGRLLHAVRLETALKYRGNLPTSLASPTLLRWIDGNLNRQAENFSHRRFYGDIGSLLAHFGVPKAKARAMIMASIFEERNWSFQAGDARANLKREVRIAVACQLGGLLGDYLYHDEVKGTLRGRHHTLLTAAMVRTSHIAQWINSNEEDMSPALAQADFFRNLAELLTRLEVRPKQFVPWIYDAIVEELESFPERDSSSLLAALAWLAMEFPSQTRNLPAWLRDLREELIDWDRLEQDVDSRRMPLLIRKDLATLTPIEARILKWRFGLEGEEELTLKEIGDKYNLSKERIRHLQEQALGKLRERGSLGNWYRFPLSTVKKTAPSDDEIRKFFDRVPHYDSMSHLKLGEEDPRPLRRWALAAYILSHAHRWGSWKNILFAVHQAAELVLKYKIHDKPKEMGKVVAALTEGFAADEAFLVRSELDQLFLDGINRERFFYPILKTAIRSTP